MTNTTKSYKEYSKLSLGYSDVAALTLIGYQEGVGVSAQVLNFGEDNSYTAYLVNEDAEIGSHYRLEQEFDGWVNIVNDYEVCAKISAKQIRFYRAGQMGCIIQTFGSAKIQMQYAEPEFKTV